MKLKMPYASTIILGDSRNMSELKDESDKC
jgi:hypothetical protein